MVLILRRNFDWVTGRQQRVRPLLNVTRDFEFTTGYWFSDGTVTKGETPSEFVYDLELGLENQKSPVSFRGTSVDSKHLLDRSVDPEGYLTQRTSWYHYRSEKSHHTGDHLHVSLMVLDVRSTTSVTGWETGFIKPRKDRGGHKGHHSLTSSEGHF